MTRPLRYGSVCSGVGTCALAWHHLGWTTAFFAEIDPFASAVLKHHWADVPNVGDFTKMRRSGWGIDLLAGGTPCQAFSMAGLRKGLTDERGNLTLEFVRLADGIDDAQPGGLPAVVWENVPGVLSDRTNAFGCFLAGLCGSDEPLVVPGGGSWSNAGVVAGPRRTAAWRVCDAQYWGVAQRRRRVVVVACPRAGGLCPATVLLELDRVRRDHPPSREARKDVAGTLTAGSQSRGWRGSVDDAAGGLLQPVAGSLAASDGGADENDAADGRLVVNHPECQHGETSHPLTTKCGMVTENCMGNGNGAPLIPVVTREPVDFRNGTVGGETASCLMAKNSPGWSLDQVPGVLEPVAYDPNQVTSKANRSNPQPGAPCHTLPAKGEPPMVVAFGSKGDGGDAAPDVSPTVRAAAHDESHANAGCPPAVAGAMSWQGGSAQDQVVGPDAVSPTLAHSSCANGGHNEPKVLVGLTVRRLTPRECERLQGYPDDHTLVPYPSRVSAADAEQLLAYWGKELVGCKLGVPADQVRPVDVSRLAADGPRYRAIGNGWAMPVFRWVGERIQAAVDARPR